MSDYTAVPLQESVPEQLATTWAAELRAFAKGTLFAAAVAVIGIFVVIAALMVGVVGAPVIAAAVAYVVLRRRRAAREPLQPGWSSARG